MVNPQNILSFIQNLRTPRNIADRLAPLHTSYQKSTMKWLTTCSTNLQKCIVINQLSTFGICQLVALVIDCGKDIQ